MSVIWKQILAAADTQNIEVPVGAEILCAREQYEAVCIWFRCDPSPDKETRRIAVCGTGHPAPSPDQGRYLGTAFLRHGALVFHVFEEIPAGQRGT